MNGNYHQRPTSLIEILGRIPTFRCATISILVSAMWLISNSTPALAQTGKPNYADPLKTLPPIIANGVILPDDKSPVLCPVQKDFSEPLQLSEAIDITLCNNPQLRMSWANIKYQAGQLGEARAAYLPTLNASATDQRMRTNYPGAAFLPDSRQIGESYSGAFNMRLFDFGARNANLKSANSLLLASISSHSATIQKTLTDVIQNYFDAQTARATWQAKKESEELSRMTVTNATRKAEHGAAAHSDVLQATAALAKASLDTNRALGDYRKALTTLVYTLGIPMQMTVELADDDHDDVKLESHDLDEWLNITAETHPAILAARAKWESSLQKVVSTRSDGLPSLDFFYNYYQNGYPNQGLSQINSHEYIYGITLNIPIFEGFARNYKIREAEAQAEQDEAQMIDTEHNILNEVVKANADALSSLENLAAGDALLEATQDSVESSTRRYQKGAADIIELLNTQAALADAKQQKIRCIAEWRSARLRLLSNAGLMGRDIFRSDAASSH